MSTATIKGFAVIEHDDNGTIHQVLVYPPEAKAEAFDKAAEIVRDYFDDCEEESEDNGEDAGTVEDAIKTLNKEGQWFGYSAAVTVHAAE